MFPYFITPFYTNPMKMKFQYSILRMEKGYNPQILMFIHFGYCQYITLRIKELDFFRFNFNKKDSQTW